MALPVWSTFDYAAIVPDDPAAYAGSWAVTSYGPPVEHTERRLRGDRLVGCSPRLRIADAGLTPDAPSPASRPFTRPKVQRSRITLTPTGWRRVTARAVSFCVAQGLTAILRPRDVLHLARTGCGGLGLSVIRDGRLVVAVGAVDAVPLANVAVNVPLDVIAEVEAVLKRRDPDFTYEDLFNELPVELSVGSQRHLRYRGRFELGDYDVYVGHGFRPGVPGEDMCVAISLKGACSAVAANASAQLLDFDGLTIAD